MDTGNFSGSLREAESRLKATEAAITSTEQRARGLGQTSATVARSYERLNERIGEQRAKLQQTASAFTRGEATSKQMASALGSVDRATAGVKSRLADTNARLTDFTNKGRGGFTAALGSMRIALAGAGIAFTGIAYGIGRSAMEVSDMQNILKAATGSTAGAVAKFKELNAVAQRSPGVMTTTAVSTYALLKPMNIAEGTINGLIQAFGRIKLSLPTADINQFAFNLNQLAVSFDKADFKQAVENFPRFGEIVKKSFDLQSAQDDIEGLIGELRKLKEAGKLTKESWLAGFAESVNKDFSLGALEDTIRTKFEKLVQRIQISVAPIGEKVSASALSIFDTVTWGDAIQGFFVSAASLILQGGLGLLTTIATIFGEISIALASPFLSDTAIADMRKNITDTYTSLSTSISSMEADFYSNLRQTRIDSINNVLNDPAASEALKEVARKQLEGLQQGMAEGTKAAQTIIQQSGENLKKTLDDLAKNANISADLRKRLQEEAKKVGDSVKSGIDVSKTKISASTKDLQDTLNKLMGDVRISPNLKKAIESELKQIQDVAKKAAQQIPTQMKGIQQQISDNIFTPQKLPSDGLIKMLKPAIDQGKAEGGKGGLSVGQQISLGVASGIGSGQSGVINAAIRLANAAAQAARDALAIQSPSKVFFAIGKDTAQGFIDGLAAMKASAQSAMASLLDVTGIKGLSKKNDAEGIGLLSSLISEIAKFNIVTKEQEIRLELTAGKYAKLNKEVRERILLAAQESDRLKAVSEAQELYREILDKMGPANEKSMAEVVAEKLKTEAWKNLNATMKERLKLLSRFADFAARKELNEDATDTSITRGEGPGGGGLGGLPTDDSSSGGGEETSVPPRMSWAVYWTEAGVKMDQFWTMLRVRIDQFKASLPSVRQALGENLVNVVAGIGDVFANAVAQWDGTAAGFFKSLAQGFRQMIQQIISELIRLMVMKAVMQLIGAFAGAGGGGATAPAAGGGVHAAGGGLVRGPGTSTSDSIFARLSNNEYVIKAKAVAHYGAGLFDRLNNLQMPNLAFAGGGLVGGSSVSSIYNNSSAFSPTVNVYMPPSSNSGGSGGGMTKDQIERAVTSALYRSQIRNK